MLTHEDDVRRFNQVSSRCRVLERQHDHFDVFVILEVCDRLRSLPNISKDENVLEKTTSRSFVHTPLRTRLEFGSPSGFATR